MYIYLIQLFQEPWSEAHQERLELLRARVLELNRQLGALAAGWRHGQLSLHMNLALPAPPLPGAPKNASILRSQNRMLTEVDMIFHIQSKQQEALIIIMVISRYGCHLHIK